MAVVLQQSTTVNGVTVPAVTVSEAVWQQMQSQVANGVPIATALSNATATNGQNVLSALSSYASQVGVALSTVESAIQSAAANTGAGSVTGSTLTLSSSSSTPVGSGTPSSSSTLIWIIVIAVVAVIVIYFYTSKHKKRR